MELRLAPPRPAVSFKQGQLANDATSSVYDKYLRCILSITCLLNHFSAFLIGWSKESRRNALFSHFLTKAWRTDRPTDRRTDPLIEMRGRI